MESNTASTFDLQIQEGQKLRDGRYGPVFLALRLDTGVLISAERLDLDEFGEVAVLKSVASQLQQQQQQQPEQPVVAYIGHKRSDGHSYLLTEHMPGGTLEDFLAQGAGKKGVELSMAASILRQVVGALERLQRRGLAVALVDPKRVLLDSQGKIKLDGPFFCDRAVTGEPLPPACLTVPELVFGQGASMRKADVWLLGVLAAQLLSGKQDAVSGRAASIAAQLRQDQKSGFDLLVSDRVKSLPDSDLALDFLRQCFTVNVDERPSISELKGHPFLASPAA
ncbi:serine/threonine protein kinase [Gaeumannomyces tritici R3-111a-1]|uniref:Serine/threonine protein kinase n=1 Tax=Gaeumannomyces tritici (strain R3-111a-1) TaxID=644352 RepID=J3PJP4_GAET3|nr:serine/threonine protein kinase [Gaeumannomyces tritici R3-111a-1]EJT68694.1 serine/threonine protein kinase [Gaeumannomyces tritici R3-111a-1]